MAQHYNRRRTIIIIIFVYPLIGRILQDLLYNKLVNIWQRELHGTPGEAHWGQNGV